jgi:hypothetical protein
LPALSTYAAEQELKARILASELDQSASMGSARDIAENIRAAASTTKVLTQSAGIKHPVTDIFWTSGSLVMNVLVTNPLDGLNTSVNIHVPIPSDISPEDIIKKSDGLRVEYDSAAMQYALVGTLSLPKGDTSDLTMEFKDVWSMPEQELQAVEEDAGTFYKELSGTSFAPRALSLYESIADEIDSIREKQRDASSPYEKLVAQKDSKVILLSAQQNLSELAEMGTQHRHQVLNKILIGIEVPALLIAFFIFFGGNFLSSKKGS